jgi:hypothetical protein
MSGMLTIAWVSVVVLIVVSFLVVVLLLGTKKQGVRTPNCRGLFLFGLVWFFVGVVLMAVYVLLGVPFWIGIPVAVLGLVYQVFGLWRQWKTQRN